MQQDFIPLQWKIGKVKVLWKSGSKDDCSNYSPLRAILQESEAKLEMKNFNPPSFWCGGRLPGGINKNNHIWIGRCIVAMVTALDHVGQTSMF